MFYTSPCFGEAQQDEQRWQHEDMSAVLGRGGGHVSDLQLVLQEQPTESSSATENHELRTYQGLNNDLGSHLCARCK